MGTTNWAAVSFAAKIGAKGSYAATDHANYETHGYESSTANSSNRCRREAARANRDRALGATGARGISRGIRGMRQLTKWEEPSRLRACARSSIAGLAHKAIQSNAIT